jgi:hypothetical protein
LDGARATRLVGTLFRLAESRGKEAAGIALATAAGTTVFKRAEPATRMIRTPEYRDWLREGFAGAAGWIGAIGHSRLVTNGSQFDPRNNQPVDRGELVTVHNGIIVNVDELWAANPGLERSTDVDTEVLAALAGRSRAAGASLPEALAEAYAQIKGMASTLTLAADTASLVAMSNNGSLYWTRSADGLTTLFASESLILTGLMKRDPWAREAFRGSPVVQVTKGRGVAASLVHSTVTPFAFAGGQLADGQAAASSLLADGPAEERPVWVNVEAPPARRDSPALVAPEPAPVDLDAIHALRRCSKCVLPETMPFIEFYAEGVCYYCRTHSPEEYLGVEALHRWAERIRRPGGEVDSLVAFSGGRDSSYGLHYLVKELGLRPIAFTYDWGMVTDLARRNQSRMCAQLGTELLIVSADIRAKRRNIRDNVAAWLRQPDLGLVPLFMAGDKQYFWYANRTARAYGLSDVLLASNPFEKTHFKSGFCGVRPSQLGREGRPEDLEHLALGSVAKMAAHYAKQYLTNPGYINRSLIDTATATASYYAIPHDYWRLFSYIPWVEKTVDETLLGLYDWETSPEADSTWRIGDGTAPWYNYIYYRVCGFTENDTLRSNQIREGQVSREFALAAVDRDNAPRYESMAWYFDAIGLDMWDAVRTVDRIPRRY